MSPEHTVELIDTASKVMLDTAAEVSPAEILRAKAQLKASLVMNLESASSRADQIARQFLAFGEVPSIPALVAKIEAVTATDVSALARRIFQGKRPALGAVGQLSNLAPHSAIAAHFA